MGLLTAPTVKKVEFHKSKIADGRQLSYLCNRLTAFDEIWHGNAHCPHTADGGSRHDENHKNRDIFATV